MVKDFKLTPAMLPELNRQITEALKHNKALRVNVVGWREKRSLSQNALSHVWYEHMSKYLISKGRENCSPSWVKEAMKHTFLGYEMVEKVNVLTGERVTVSELKHTSKLDVGDMTHYMNKVYKWALDIGCLLPIPEDCEYKQNLDKQEA